MKTCKLHDAPYHYIIVAAMFSKVQKSAEYIYRYAVFKQV